LGDDNNPGSRVAPTMKAKAQTLPNSKGGKGERGFETYWLGHFDTAEEAHAAYIAKARELFGGFARAE
jgi:hypothetical protein